MTEQVSQRQLRNDRGRNMRALEEGRTFVVTRSGQPVGELRPLRRQRFIDAVAVSESFQQGPRIDWVQMRDDLEAVADQDPTPRA